MLRMLVMLALPQIEQRIAGGKESDRKKPKAKRSQAKVRATG
jgi:hypothetical protein